jgi:hypothetical protein
LILAHHGCKIKLKFTTKGSVIVTDDEFLACLKEHPELWDTIMRILLEPSKNQDDRPPSS